MIKRIFKKIKNKVSILLVFVMIFSLINVMDFGIQKVYAATIPASEDYQSYTAELPTDNVPVPREIGDWRYSLLKSDESDHNNNNTVNNPPYVYIRSNLGVGYALGSSASAKALEVCGWVNEDTAFQVKSKSGNEFKFKSFNVENNGGAGGTGNYKVVGYKDIVIVPAVTQNFNAQNGTSTSVVLSGNGWYKQISGLKSKSTKVPPPTFGGVNLHTPAIVSRLFKLFIPSVIEEIAKSSGFMKRHSKLKVRLVGIKLSDKIAHKRIPKAIIQNDGNDISSNKRERLHWNLMVTNIKEDLLSSTIVTELYRIRWQIDIVASIVNAPNYYFKSKIKIV